MEKAKQTMLGLLFILPLLLAGGGLQANAATKITSASLNTNLIVGGLFLLVFIKLSVAAVIGYFWYRKSKFKKQKIVLDI